MSNTVDIARSYHGPGRLKIGGRNAFQHPSNIRRVMRGALQVFRERNLWPAAMDETQRRLLALP